MLYFLLNDSAKDEHDAFIFNRKGTNANIYLGPWPVVTNAHTQCFLIRIALLEAHDLVTPASQSPIKKNLKNGDLIF